MDEIEKEYNLQTPESIGGSKEKILIKKEVWKTIGVSAASSLVVFAVVGIVLWQYRTLLVTKLLASVPNQNLVASVGTNATAVGLGQTTPLALLPKDLSVTDVVSKANKSVVSIEVSQQVPVYQNDGSSAQSPFGDLFPGLFFSVPNQQQIGTKEQVVGGGTGFFVSSDGLIVTNRHVVDFANATFTAITIDGKKYPAKLVAKDGVLDVAILKVTGSGFTAVTLGNSDSLALGQSVVAIGYALGQFNNSISVGVVSGLSRSITAGDESGNSELLDKVIQTDAAINPGNSGGPLLNLRGEVIGVNVAVAQGSQSIGFALPINTVKQVIDSVKKTGTIVRPYVGIRYAQITADLKTQNNLSVDYGILVRRGAGINDLAVIPGSPADKAGIVENDIILSIDGAKLDGTNDFSSIVRSKRIGDVVVLQVLSKGIQKTISLTLAKAPN